MADLLPSSPDVEAPEGSPRVLGVDSDDADEVIAALSSATSRQLLSALHDDPATPSELANEVDTSLQNAQYHIEKLSDADLIDVVGTRYSEKGREMNVYAPTDGPLVLFAGGEEETHGVKSALKNLLGAVGVLALVSVLVQAATRGLEFPFSSGAGAGAGGDGGGPSIASTETVQRAEEAAGLPPGVLFFLGGLFVLAVVGAVWYVRRG